MMFKAVLCLGVVVILTDAVTIYPVSSNDVCKIKNLQLETVGQSGFLTFDNTSADTNQDFTCVLKIEACSSCQIELKSASENNINFYCPLGSMTSRYCSIGCDYLFVFDMDYMNETMRYYKSWRDFTEFKSESSSVFILFCHGYSKNYSFKIAYNTTRKLIKKYEVSDSSAIGFGYITSPYFPAGYAQNHEVYEYQFDSPNPGDYIQIMFEDWHLSDTTVFNFENSNIRGQVTGRSSRPVVISNKNSLRFTFHTGVSLVAGENRDYLGYRASYKFYSNRMEIPQPKTNCKSDSYYMSSVGGKIEFSTSSPSMELYDCLWVLKKSAGFDGIFLKIDKFITNGHLIDPSYHNNYLIIRNGVTSLGHKLETLKMWTVNNNHDGVAHFSDTGFYLRLNATMSSVNKLSLSYASYKNGGCGSSLFVCDNRRCIDPSLVCDGADHCGDNSDEVSGCKGNNSHWDKSYQYTITIGVIVPMVICLLFVVIRRCRRAQLNEVAENERLRTISEDVSGQHSQQSGHQSGGRRRRRRRRGFFGQAEIDNPPTYDEAIQNPPGWYQNVAFGNLVDPTLPQPPSYHEAVNEQLPEQSTSNQRSTPGSPISTDSSQSELTVCSGNLSDSSSSSDEGSTWGAYTGEGEGRRGRLGRHVSSSDSETFTTVDQTRSSIPSPELNESVPVRALCTSVENSAETAVSPSLDNRTGNGDRNLQKIHDKNLRKISNSQSDDFVVPTGPKPGETESSPQRQLATTAHDTANQSIQAPRPAPRKSLDNHNNNARGPNDHTDSRSKPKRKPKAKPPRTNTSAVNNAYERSDTSCHGSESADDFNGAANISLDSYPGGSSPRNRGRNVRRRVEHQAMYSRSVPERLDHVNDDMLQNYSVVNVDDDEVIFMYGSQNSVNRPRLGSSQYSLPETQLRNESRAENPGRSHSGDRLRPSRGYAGNRHNLERGSGSVGQSPVRGSSAVRRRTEPGLESISYNSSQNNLDNSVMSVGHLTNSSERLYFTNRTGRGVGNEQLPTSHLSLNTELENMEDVYV